MNTDVMAANVNLQQSMVDLLNRLPARMRNDPAVTTLCAQLEHQPVDIVHLIYRNKPYELDSKDYEFSRAMMQEHWDAGGRDMRATVSHPEWMKSATENGITTYDLAEPEAVRVRHPGVLAR